MCKREPADRSGNQQDGSAKTRGVKLVTIWGAEGRDEEGVAVRDEGSIGYWTGIESAASRDTDGELSDFAHRVEREAARWCFEDAPRHVILGDGAPWIWDIATEPFPRTIQIVDRYHVNERLSHVGRVIHGPGSELWEYWTHEQCTGLKAGKIDSVLAALWGHLPIKEARECHGHIKSDRSRMRYDGSHAAGLCTSCAVVVSGCKRAIGLRLKRGGMFWTAQGANAIIALRCCRLGRRFEDFRECRSLRRTS